MELSHKLIQENHLALCFEAEYLFKGYQILNKSNRKLAFANIAKIKADFEDFLDSNPDLKFPGVEFGTFEKQERFDYLYAISQYLQPESKFRYKASSSIFGSLSFKNELQFVADCNQLVNLYVYLYSLKFPVVDLQIKLLKDHVCLHYNGFDFETTTAKITKYDEFEYIADISELIAVNILDISDSDLKTADIHVDDFHLGCLIVMNLSSNKKIASHNLKVAYQKLAMHYEEIESFKKAAYFWKLYNKSEDLLNFFKRVAKFYTSKQKFKLATKFAKKSKSKEFINFAYRSWVDNLVNANKFEYALKIAKKSKDQDLIKFAAAKLYNFLGSTIKKDPSAVSYNRKVYKQMLKLAYTLNDSKLVNQLKQLINT